MLVYLNTDPLGIGKRVFKQRDAMCSRDRIGYPDSLEQPRPLLTRWLEYAIARGMLGGLRFLPLPLARLFSNFCAKLLDLLIPKLRRVARINLGFAMPELSPGDQEHVIDGVFRSIARLLLAMSRFPDIDKTNVDRWIRYEGLEHYLAAKAKGRGVLVATAHLGNWELSAFTHAIMTEPMNVMVRPLDNPYVDHLVETRRQLSGNQLIVKRDSALTVVRALKNNQAVGMLIDQNTTASEGVFVEFFGKKACASVAFAKLAARIGSAVIPGFAFWHESERRYVLRFYPELEISGDAQADTQRIHAFFEEVIRQYPDQWMWIHRRWKTRPEGEPPIY